MTAKLGGKGHDLASGLWRTSAASIAPIPSSAASAAEPSWARPRAGLFLSWAWSRRRWAYQSRRPQIHRCELRRSASSEVDDGCPDGVLAKPQNKTSQTWLSHGTLVEQALPRKFAHQHPSDMGYPWEWPEWATRIINVGAIFASFQRCSWLHAEDYFSGNTFFGTL